MVEARELTNSELKELAGFTLTGSDNAKLVKAGLVTTDRSHRPFSHELTEKGWHVVRKLHHSAAPPQAKSATRSLLTVLANTHRALDRLRVSPADFFQQASAPEPATTGDAPVVTSDVVAGERDHRAGENLGADIPQLIRSAYRDLASSAGAWVGLADLRDHLVVQDRATVDEALRALVRQPGVRIIPVANSKALTTRDRAAAVRIGDEDNHTLSIGPA